MNKKLLVLAPLALFGLNEPAEVGAQADCATVNVPPVCQRGSQVTINTQTSNVSPPNVCASPGSSVSFNVVPTGTAVVVSKNGTSWLSGSGNAFAINVPGDAAGSYDYAVFFEDGSCIDPRISIDD